MTDRIRSTATLAAPPSCDVDMDAALRRVLAALTPARQLLNAVADQIGARQHGHRILTGTVWQDAVMAAHQRVLHGRCEHVVTTELGRAFAALPPYRADETRSEFALRVRAAARTL